MRRGSVSPRRRLRTATGRLRRIAATIVAGALIGSALVALPATVGPAPEPASATFDFSCRSAEGYAYFVNTNSQSVSIVYTGTDSNIRNIPLGGGAPYGITATPDGSQIYVAGGPTGVSVINADTFAVTNISHSSFSTPVGAWASPDGTRIFISNYTSNTVSVISTATNTVTSVINLGGTTAISPGYMDASGNLLFVGRLTSQASPGVVSVIDMTTGALVRTIAQANGGLDSAHSIAVNGTYIATAAQTGVVEIRNQSAPSALARTITMPSGGGSIHGISFVNGTNYLVVGTGSNAVHVYDATTGALLRTFTPGNLSVRTVVVSPIVNGDGTRDIFLSTTNGSASNGGLDRAIGGYRGQQRRRRWTGSGGGALPQSL
ncbi:YncE family protein [Microbacterium sp.]|uniref:YncE family protein n=1 Tax=Microbacterium sp. TaxID=51671 RepID=UPI002FE35F53